MKTAVIGCGAWGTTLAKILAENGHQVSLWCHDKKIAEAIQKKKENTFLLPGIKLPQNIQTCTVLAEIQAELFVLVTASEFFKATLMELKNNFNKDTLILSATKGLDKTTDKTPMQIMSETFPQYKKNMAVLSGPNIAVEIAKMKPATTVISADDPETAGKIQKIFYNNYFRVYTNHDVIGTEMGGTLKNIIAIAAGIIDGLELGDNAKSALMVRGMVEMSKLAIKMGARQETLFGLTGMGDLITTCSSKLSRNHFVGQELARGKKLSEILQDMKAVAEGVNTAKAAYDLSQKLGVTMPVTEQIYQILFQDKNIEIAIKELMSRDLKSEQ